MSVESLYTQTATQAGQKSAGSASDLLGGSSALSGGLNFLDMLLAQIDTLRETHGQKAGTDLSTDKRHIESQAQSETQSTLAMNAQNANTPTCIMPRPEICMPHPSVLPISNNALMAELPLSGEGSEISINLDELLADSATQKTNFWAEQNISPEELLATIKHLNAQTEETSDDIDLEKLTKLIKSFGQQKSEILFSSLNLTPADLDALEQQIKELASKFDQDQDKVLGAGAAARNIEAAAAAAAQEQAATRNNAQKSAQNDLAKELNNIVIGEDGEEAALKIRQGKSSMGEMAMQDSDDAEAYFKNALNKAGAKQSSDYTAQDSNAAQKSAEDKNTASHQKLEQNLIKQQTRVLTTTTLDGDINAMWSNDLPDWMTGHANANPSAASLSQTITQNVQAGHPHPASQTVAATIQKAAGRGENKNITLHLDPPELGRIEVQMQFGEDKALKTKLVIEKPETHLMLQRDAHALERALQDMGLDTNDGGISFELAHDGHEFARDNGRGGGHDHTGGHGSSKTAETDSLELVQSTLDWAIDPETGHTHYSILV